MTIVFLCRLFYPHIGGVEKHVREVGKRLVKDGNKLIVITELEDFHVVPLYEQIDGMEVFRIPVGTDEKGKKWVIWRWLWRNKEMLQNADIVHCHDVFFWYLPFRFIFPRKRVYTTFHGYEGYPIRWQAIWMRKIAEKLSEGNICIGEFMRKWYGTSPTYISYGGVTVPNDKKVSPKPYSALFFGRLDEQTGILTYQAVIPIINKEFPQFTLTVVGGGELSTKLDHNVTVTGFEEDIIPHLNNTRYAFVSRYLSILEALAAKRLVFAVYDNPLKEDYLKMTPFARFIIIEKTPEKLAEKVLFFLKNPEKEKQMVEKGYQWVRGQNWECVVDSYKNLWGMGEKA